jgi:hypothetical protein
MRSALTFSVAALLALSMGATRAWAQGCLPFAAGERLTYGVRVAMMGARGQAVMSVVGPQELRGRVVIELRSEASVGMGFLRGSDKTFSWVDPLTFATLRFVQHERHIISRASDSVEVYPEQRRWQRGNGTGGNTASDAPLDVLSFIYFLRTLPLAVDSSWRFDRHFDAARNPTSVRVTGRDSVTTPAGRFEVWSVEMQVRDTTHYGGDGLIRLQFTADERRLPVRIQSVMPIVGTTVMTLSSVVASPVGACHVAPRIAPRVAMRTAGPR